MTTESPTPVVFRIWKNKPLKGDVLALFPTIPADAFGALCLSYEHVGQHGGADYFHCVSISHPASPHEALPLLRELRTLGYDNLQICKKATRKMHEARFMEV